MSVPVNHGSFKKAIRRMGFLLLHQLRLLPKVAPYLRDMIRMLSQLFRLVCMPLSQLAHYRPNWLFISSNVKGIGSQSNIMTE